MITECRPKNNTKIKFDVMVMRRGWDHVTGLYFYEPEKRLVSICSQDLTDIVESATRTPGAEILIQRTHPLPEPSARWSE